MSKIVCVVPTIRQERMEAFRLAWTPLFIKHNVTLITVWDGENPSVQHDDYRDTHSGVHDRLHNALELFPKIYNAPADLFCRFTDGCRNLGFVAAAVLKPDYVLTLDDDVEPQSNCMTGYQPHDPIQAHLDVLQKRVPLSWMNTGMNCEYVRGFPYIVRDEAPVMLSHGVWVGIPDFDGETQLRLEQSGFFPHTLPYYVGPIPKGTLFPLCGMNVMIRREALPYFYFAPMGLDSGVEGLHRFADIWMGVFLKRKFDELGWACYTGGSVVHHTRASDARKNMGQEELVREWNERIEKWSEKSLDPLWKIPEIATTREYAYFRSYSNKRLRYAKLITDLLTKG